MQVSGHPSGIERTSFRCGNESEKPLDLNPMFLQMTQSPTNSEEVMRIYSDKITKKESTYMSYFGVLVSIIVNMRVKRDSMPSRDFRREYLKQSCYLVMHARESFSKDDPNSPHSNLMQFSVAQYILQKANWIDWSIVAISREEFFEGLE